MVSPIEVRARRRGFPASRREETKREREALGGGEKKCGLLFPGTPRPGRRLRGEAVEAFDVREKYARREVKP